VGHGVGVHADADPSDPRRAVRVATAAVPVYELPRTDAPSVADEPALAEVALDMKVLAEAGNDDLETYLRPLVAAYRSWIAAQRARVGDPSARLEGFEATATDVLDQCERAAARIEAGIHLVLDQNRPDVADAFRFANRAMWLQRVHTMVADLRRASPELTPDEALSRVDVAESRSWRPFQLAFILLNLPSLA